MKVTDLLQYPVKGLSAETLSQVELKTGSGMPADRLFAITHGKSQFDFNNPGWMQRNNFAVVAHSPQIGPVHCQFDHQKQVLTLTHNNQVILQAGVGDADMDEKLTLALSSVITDGQSGPFKLARAGNTRMTDSPTATVSLMNNKSLQALEKVVGQSLDKRRFRGNIWFDGDHAWQEHEWLGKAINYGKVKLYVTERIERCAAIDADPDLGIRNINLLKQLGKGFGHVDFGVLAEVDVTGLVSLDNELIV